MTDNKRRPGVMLYFDDVRPAMAAMNDEQFGAFARAVITYADTGDFIDLDGIGQFAFAMLQPKIDRDGDRYERQRLHGLYMSYCRRLKDAGREKEKLSEEDWIRVSLSETNSNYALSDSSYTLPPTPAPAPTPASTSVPAGGTGNGAAGGYKGDGGEKPAPDETPDQRRARFMDMLGGYEHGTK